MSARSHPFLAGVLAALLWCSCDDSGECPPPRGRIDPPLSDLSIEWESGSIAANMMPIVPPDPIICQARLILRNNNPREAFSQVRIRAADVILARNGSILGTIPIATDWDGLLAPGKTDTVLFYKNTGDEAIFTPPCNERVLVDFKVRNADGDTKVFRPDTLTFSCTF